MTPGTPTSTVSLTRLLLAALATATLMFIALYYPDRVDRDGAVVGAVVTLVAVPLGLAAVARLRHLPRRSIAGHARVAGLALLVGVALGVGNLLANYGIASIDSTIRDRMVAQWRHFSPWSMIVSGPLIEEVAFRIVLLGGVAWLMARLMSDDRRIFRVALIVSALVFGLMHILYGGRVPEEVLHAVGVVLKTSTAGALLGWIYWRWGFPHAIVCHMVANATHLVLMPLLF
jgi:membrane protease YdiL (CAAX protease family)